MFNKLRGFFLKGRSMVTSLAVSVTVLAMMAVPCFAVDTIPTLDVGAMMTTAVTKMVTEAFGMITSIMPILITVFTATIIIKWGMKFVKQMFSKAG